MSESKKRETLTRFFLEKYEQMNKKLKTYSPTRQLFSPLKKGNEDAEGSRDLIKQSLIITFDYLLQRSSKNYKKLLMSI